MKYRAFSVLFFILIGIIGVAGQSSPATEKTAAKRSKRIETKYDKSKDQTTIRLKQITISKLKNEKDVANNLPLHQMDLEAWFTYPGKSQPAAAVSDVTLRFHAVGSNYVFLRPQQVIVALNREVKGEDRAFALGTTEYKSEAPKFNSVYEEYLTLKVPADALQRMAKAKSVEIYVGPIGYVLTADQHLGITELADYISSPAAAGAR